MSRRPTIIKRVRPPATPMLTNKNKQEHTGPESFGRQIDAIVEFYTTISPPSHCVPHLNYACLCHSLDVYRQVFRALIIPILGPAIHWRLLSASERIPKKKRALVSDSELFPSVNHIAYLSASSSPARTNSRIISSYSLTLMSHTHPTAAASSLNSQLIISNALKEYHKRTNNDLLLHPLAAQLQTCDSPAAILTILQQQVQGSSQSRSSDDRWTKWLDPTVNVLFAFSATVGAGVSLVCSESFLIRGLHSHIHLAGILACECYICRNRRSPSGV